MKHFQIIFAFSLLLSAGCKPTTNKQAAGSQDSLRLFTLMPPDSTHLKFNNVLTESETVNPVNFQYVYNGSGVAVGDINNDGLPDIFFGANQESCRLYLNKGNFKFEDITEKAGVTTKKWCNGVTMADVNADGFIDIYICCAGKFAEPGHRANLLFINNGNLTFTEQAAQYGLDDKSYSQQASFFDYDMDGDLDVFIINQPLDVNFRIDEMKIHNSRIIPFTSSRFLKNVGSTKFEDVSKEAGIESNAFSLSCTVGDLNSDGWPDIYVCNDYTMCDFLYINNHHGGFTEENQKRLQHTSNFAMGNDIADFNNDGYMDILQADMLPEDNYRQKMLMGPNNYDRYFYLVNNGYGHQFMQNCLHVNNGNGTFSDIATFAGIEKTDWTWAALFADFDNDGWKDIFFDNGYLRDFTNLDHMMYRAEIIRKNNGKMPNQLDVVRSISATTLKSYVYRNNGDLTFENMTTQWGLDAKAFANGAAYGDLDNDGDLDLVINNLNSYATVYRNNANAVNRNNFIAFYCKGNKGNPQGTGTTITIYTGEGIQVANAMPTRGFASAVDGRIHFGLGKLTHIDSAAVVWPDGKMQRLYNLKPNQFIALSFSEANDGSNNTGVTNDKNNGTKFFNSYNPGHIDYRHQENEFIDFKREPLLPQLYSRMGPGLAVGDVNKDGLDDFYAGGAKGQAGGMYLQNKSGLFEKSVQQAFITDQDQEDVAALFFDADGDGDMDLYIVSGGSEETGYSAYYQDRIYMNNGNGIFQKSVTSLPVINSSGYCIVAGDYDGDGDPDLFRGGRISPGNYPFHPKSYLLRNDHGKFTDVSEIIAPGLSYTGMVTAACWMDYDNDKKLDLIVTGEWMPVKIYKNDGSRLKEVTNEAGMSYTNGWWSSLAFADMDQDGDLDILAGNMGTNTRIRTSPENPACVYAKDFDANGSTDAIICHLFPDNIVYPMYGRDELIDQIRVLRKRLPKYTDYADKTIDKIFSPEELKNAYVEKAYTFLSSYFENTGKGTFIMKPLPLQVQLSQVNAMLTGDFNGDGFTDALVAGNNFSLTPTQGRLDAGTGLLLKGDGKGSVQAVGSDASGFFANKDVKSMVLLKAAGMNQILVVGNNNDVLQFYKLKK